MSPDEQKRAVGRAAIEHVENGMTIGLGTGSTAKHFVDALGEKVADGWIVKGVPTSEQTARQAESLGIPLISLDEVTHIDVTVDGADELDAKLRLIKGGGGALLREKIVAAASNKIVTIADASKFVDVLGAFPLPVEVVNFGCGTTLRRLIDIGRAHNLDTHDLDFRMAGEIAFKTDGGNLIADCAFKAIQDPEALARDLSDCPGVVDHGIFLGLSSLAILGTGEGVRVIKPE
ncbi:MAG: ribose-5-phosphate isomerase RpiA [Alphaproteobacteria bacterium]|nr:MAG: ribose-5-phosphate isomerase RpiA [Alphaproteobacteria bacterium]